MRDLIEQRIRELLADPDERRKWLRDGVREHHFLPLHVGWVEALGIRPDLSYVQWDHGETRRFTTLEDPYWQRVALAAGARTYAELAPLLPRRPAEALDCSSCGGAGWFKHHSDIVCVCAGLGWVLSGEQGAAGERTRADLIDFEYDWIGIDADGCGALFSTAGGGYAPPELIRDPDAHKRAIEAILARPATTEARFAPELGPGCVNTWKLVAERGLYAYDADVRGGPYRLDAAPVVPSTAIERFGGIVVLPNVRFATMTLLTQRRLMT